jgi:hypothetical protein
MFTRNQFQLILKFFHLVDNRNLSSLGKPEYDLFAKVQLLTDNAN